MPSPSLIINRLRVDGELACDISFERGLNIIVGESDATDPRKSNACGKTTLIELIQCGLGRRYGGYADIKELASIRGQVKTLWLEIEANGQLMLIERSLTSITGLLRIRWERYREGIDRTIADSVAVDELSRLLMDRLGIPEVSVKQADGSLEPLGFQSLRRAFILHQEDSFLALLDKVQPFQRRSQIIGFLTCVRSLDAFAVEEEAGVIQQQAVSLERSIEEIARFLRRAGVSNLGEAQAAATEAARAVDAAKAEQREIQNAMKHAQRRPDGEEEAQSNQLRTAILGLDARERELLQSEAGLTDQINELRELVGSLSGDERKLRRVRASSARLSSVTFAVCPRCLQAITTEMNAREAYGRCCLCARPISHTSDTEPRSLPNEAEIAEHHAEATRMVEVATVRLQMIRDELSQIRGNRDNLDRQLDQVMQAYVSPAVDRLVAQADIVAERAAALAQAQTFLHQAHALHEMQRRLVPLKSEYSRLTLRLQEARKASLLQLESFRSEFEAIMRAVDWPYFHGARIDPETLMPEINDLPYTAFGTGMKGVVIVCYHLAMLALAQHTQTFMPQLLVVDSPAVGDLNERSHDALLRYIAALGESLGKARKDRESGAHDDWQVILTTRRMINELEPYRTLTLKQPDKMLLRPRRI